MKLETKPVKKWWWEVYKPADLFEWSVYLFTGLLFKKIIVRYRYFVDGKEVNGPYVQQGCIKVSKDFKYEGWFQVSYQPKTSSMLEDGKEVKHDHP